MSTWKKAMLHHDEITEIIIGCAFDVANQLGVGFLEKVYENAMMLELKKKGLSAEQQKAVTVFYDNVSVGEFFTDILVEGQVVVELKVAKALDNSHQAQLMNYLRACDMRVGLLINFGTSHVEIKRIKNGYDD